MFKLIKYLGERVHQPLSEIKLTDLDDSPLGGVDATVIATDADGKEHTFRLREDWGYEVEIEEI